MAGSSTNGDGIGGGGDWNGMSNGNDGGAGRRGGFTSLFKRTPDH
jgi:hypothetical protein